MFATGQGLGFIEQLTWGLRLRAYSNSGLKGLGF